uniref:ARID domain-containing protein n=1 Tax=Taenia asiatica TaxID=60517 RepID=A0A0R3VZC1_TAEAS
LLDAVKAVLYLIEHPNFAPVNNSFGMLENPEQLPSKTVRLLAGLPAKGYRLAFNTAWCEWARANGCLPTREEEVDATEEFEAEVEKRAVATEDKLSEAGPANKLKTVNPAEDAALNDEKSSDYEDAAIEFEKPPDDTDRPKVEAHSEMSTKEADMVSRSESSPVGDENSYLNKPADRGARSLSPASSVTYSENWQSCPSLRDCTHCGYEFNAMKALVNLDLSPQWKWVFRQTQWPIRFAPQQNVDLSMTGILIPPWRVSVGRLLLDFCRFCAKNREMRNLVLLDPMVRWYKALIVPLD